MAGVDNDRATPVRAGDSEIGRKGRSEGEYDGIELHGVARRFIT